MAATRQAIDIRSLAPPPENPLPYRQRLRIMRDFHTGLGMLRDAGGSVTRLTMGPRWLFPPIVVATSPRAAQDILGRTDAFVDKADFYEETRRLMGGNLLNLAHREWLPRRRSVQHVFTKQHVREFGGHAAHVAQGICESWADGAQIDLDAECRLLTLRTLGRSVFGLDLDDDIEQIYRSLMVLTSYFAGRASRPVHAPSWMSTPARWRVRKASRWVHGLALSILTECRRDPQRQAPLVRALMEAKDPATGRPLSDTEICDELVLFMLAGHHTTSTALTYALWQLGRHQHIQDRVRAEVRAMAPNASTREAVDHLVYTNQVVQEALRMCPPVSAIARTVMRDIDIDGYRVAAGTVLSFGVWAVHWDPGLWTSPSEFRPERFEPARAKQLDRWQYLPFGGGPRACIGGHFAMLQMTLAIAAIVGRCRLSSLRDDFPVLVPITTVPAEPVPARVINLCDSASDWGIGEHLDVH